MLERRRARVGQRVGAGRLALEQARLAPAPPQRIDRAVRGDREQPAPERSRRVVAAERGVRAREALLGRVLGIGRRAEQPPAQALHVGPVVADELAECVAVARPRAREPLRGQRLVANRRRSGSLHPLES